MSSNKQQNVILRSLLSKLESHRVGNLIKMYYVLLEQGASTVQGNQKRIFLNFLKPRNWKKGVQWGGGGKGNTPKTAELGNLFPNSFLQIWKGCYMVKTVLYKKHMWDQN